MKTKRAWGIRSSEAWLLLVHPFFFVSLVLASTYHAFEAISDFFAVRSKLKKPPACWRFAVFGAAGSGTRGNARNVETKTKTAMCGEK
jgi:hypothetical protein